MWLCRGPWGLQAIRGPGSAHSHGLICAKLLSLPQILDHSIRANTSLEQLACEHDSNHPQSTRMRTRGGWFGLQPVPVQLSYFYILLRYSRGSQAASCRAAHVDYLQGASRNGGLPVEKMCLFWGSIPKLIIIMQRRRV